MVFQGSLKGVSMKFSGCFMQVSRTGSFSGVSRKFQASFKEDWGVFWGSYEDVSRVFLKSFIDV